MTEERDTIILRMQNNKLFKQIIIGWAIHRVTCFPSGTELSLPYNETDFEEKIAVRRIEFILMLYLCNNFKGRKSFK